MTEATPQVEPWLMHPALLNASVAVETDPHRLHDEHLDDRLAAAVLLAPSRTLCRALLAGVPVPAHRLEPRLVRELRLDGDVVLDETVALAVIARGPRS